jgi:hypothetical protein
MQFRKETIKEVNSYCDTTLTSDMTFAQAVDNIDAANNSYFYVSMAKEDVVEAINNEPELTEYLKLNNVYIKELGIYISLT